jgi:DNA-3-methyladenine glycosylase II
VLAALMDRVGPEEEAIRPERPREHYGSLVRTITGQQLSTKAAASIYGRLEAFFGGHTPQPEELLAADPEEMRLAAGLSRAKTSYLRSLAEHVIDGSLELDKLHKLSEEEVIAELTAIKGLGQWSADMFLMFHLGRPDILPVGDLGIRKAVMIEYRLRKLPDPKRLEKIAKPWRPYRTTACLYLWRSLDNAPEV